MLEIFITAFLVVGFLNFFLFIIIKKIAQNVTEQTKSYFVDKLQIYDDLIEEKESVLDDLNKKLDKAKETTVNDTANHSSSLNYEELNFDLRNPSYKDEDLLSYYKKINEKFNINEEEVVLNFINLKFKEDNVATYNSLNSLRIKFNSDFVYDMSTLPLSVQKKFVLNNFFEEELEVINYFLKINKTFNCLDFIKYLDKRIEEEDPNIYIKTGTKNTNYNHINKYIVTLYDPNISKGIQIIYKNKLYDCAL